MVADYDHRERQRWRKKGNCIVSVLIDNVFGTLGTSVSLLFPRPTYVVYTVYSYVMWVWG